MGRFDARTITTLFYLAQDADGDEIDVLSREVMTLGDADDATDFASCFPNADIHALQRFVLERGGARQFHSFARRVDGANITAFRDALCERGDAVAIVDFAANICEGSIDDRGYQAVLDSGDPSAMWEMIRVVPESKWSEVSSAILATRDPFYATEIALRLPGADISVCQQVAIDSGSAEAILHFARNVPGADIEALRHAMARTMTRRGGAGMADFESEFPSAPSTPDDHEDDDEMIGEEIT